MSDAGFEPPKYIFVGEMKLRNLYRVVDQYPDGNLLIYRLTDVLGQALEINGHNKRITVVPNQDVWQLFENLEFILQKVDERIGDLITDID